MLVLSRLKGQAIRIAGNVIVKIVDVRGDKVRIGIEAPQDVKVFREEIFLEIQAENQSAANMQPEDLLGAIGLATSQARSSNLRIASEELPMDPFMRAAIDEARQGLAEGGLPIGSVLVRGNQIIGRGHNRRVQHGDPMAHAEINCLTQAGRQKTYADTVLYSTLMPCYLCTGAVIQFGIPKVIVGESVNFPGGEAKAGKSPDFMRANGIEVTDLHDPECIEMMSQFIREHPQLWNEDIGV
ncbi:MAG TPA: carbon storage regulator CsrA [Tepidisphaeraceae bacterium]